MTAVRWHLLLLSLQGLPAPLPPDLPGRRIEARDEPMSEAELSQIDDPRELALCAGITRQAAHQRLQARATTAPKGNP